jgi:hypothetical protein
MRWNFAGARRGLVLHDPLVVDNHFTTAGQDEWPWLALVN